MAVWSEVSISKMVCASRFDTEYWKPEYLEIESILASAPCDRLENLVQFVRCGPFGSNLLCETYVPDGVIVIRPFNLRNMTVERDNLVSIDREDCVANNLHFYQKGDIAFARVGDVRTGIVPDFSQEVTISPNIIAARPNRERVNPFFLVAFMNSRYGQMQLERATKIVAQPTITVDIVKGVLVPKLPQDIQDAIEKKVKLGFDEEKQSHDLYHQAERLLLAELGLDALDTSPTLFYERNFSEIRDARRLDAEFYQPKYYRVLDAIQSKSHATSDLGALVKPIRNGFDAREYTEEGIPYVRVGDIKEGRIDLDNAKKLSLSPSQINKDIKLSPGDVLFTRKGSFGNAAVVRPGQEKAIISSEIMLLQLKEAKILPEYLSVYLNSPLGYQQIERHVHGVAFFSISQKDLASIQVILAPEELQERIQVIVRESDQCHKESKRLLEEAKRMVEEAIFNE